MKHLRETFTDEEWEVLKEAKESTHLTWREYLKMSAQERLYRLHHGQIGQYVAKTKKVKSE